MKKIAVFLVMLASVTAWSQEDALIHGKVLNDANDKALENVHVVNLNSVKGTITDEKGDFEIRAAVNDTLYFSYLGRSSLPNEARHAKSG